jgi:hypothetical protein
MAFACSPLSLNTRPLCYQIKALSPSHHHWVQILIIVIIKNLTETKPKASQRDYCSGSAITGDRFKD